MEHPHENVARLIREDERVEKEPTALERVIQTVAEDAKANPEAYIRQTIVPEGGE